MPRVLAPDSSGVQKRQFAINPGLPVLSVHEAAAAASLPSIDLLPLALQPPLIYAALISGSRRHFDRLRRRDAMMMILVGAQFTATTPLCRRPTDCVYVVRRDK